MIECFMCHKRNCVLQSVSYTSGRMKDSDGIIQVCNDCYGVLFE